MREIRTYGATSGGAATLLQLTHELHRRRQYGRRLIAKLPELAFQLWIRSQIGIHSKAPTSEAKRSSHR